MNWLALPLAVLFAAAPAARPFVAQGDYWEIRLDLPAGWKSCTAPAPAPNHGFALAPRDGSCAAAVLRFLVENNLDDALPDLTALQQQAGCSAGSKAVEIGGRGWNVCRDASQGETALHVQACGENPNDAVIFTLQRSGGDAAAAALFGRVLESVKLRCPSAPH
ncbi:hypothetical protein [Tahibacter harae]|uniref:DUF3558 domain-containing protein n=1 Tax=Tahibacter harae TaxID=2963937 RepID=A0ABT1QYD5_9GAMM|nr:hypothetical protein [Tahibacter harae]MCQ4167270.1 hypothetical protein [Tahibacter harae]